MNSIIYPPTIKTDFERLCAVYPLIEQMRLEHNGVAELARSDWGKYAGKFRTYARESKARLKKLLAERNRLIWNIRESNKALFEALPADDEESYLAVCKSVFGDKEELKVQTTKATSPLLDELKALNLDEMPETLGSDPTEDFTSSNWNNGVAQSDPNSRLTITANRVTWAGLTSDETCYFYRDAGVDHFSGNFEHLLKVYDDYGTGSSRVMFWSLANYVGALDGGQNHIYSFVYYSTAIMYLRESYDSSSYSDYCSISFDTVYYCEIERDENVGTYGTLYNYVCTGNYYDDGGSLVDTLNVALHVKDDYRYIYAVQSRTGVTAYRDGYVELLDLQEAGVTPKTGSDSGTGAESSEETAALSKSETGSGVEQSLLSYLLSSSDSGSGVEVAALIAVLMLGDSGIGSDVSMLPWLEAIFGGDEGSGFDALKALIETTGSGSDIRLHGRTGQVRMPSKGVNL